MESLEIDEILGGSQASGVIQAIMANKEDYLSKLNRQQLNIVGEHFGVDKKVRRKDGDMKRKYVRKNHSALQIREQVGDLERINDFIKERFPDVRPKKYTLKDKLGKNYPDGRNQLASKSVLQKGAEEGKEDYERNLRLYNERGTDTNIRARHTDGRWIDKFSDSSLARRGIPYNTFFATTYEMMNTNPNSGRMRGRGVPPEKTFWKSVKNTYKPVAPNDIGDGYVKIVDTSTFDAYLRESDKSILIGLRGTKITSWTDLKADALIVANRLRQSKRYKKDVDILRKVIATYPPEKGYEYYLSGHSLSVAIANELMREFPFIKKAVGYNGAFQPADLLQQNPDIKRLYTDKDFLYNLGGKMFRNVKVVPMTETKARGFFGRIQSALTPSGIKGHTLDNFKPLYGLGMKERRVGGSAELVRRVQARKVGGKVGGASFKKGDSPNLFEKIAFAPGRNQGEIKRIKNWWKDIIKNEVDFSVERAISIMSKGAGPNGVPSAFMVRRFLEQQKHQGDKPIYDKFIGKTRELESVEDQAVSQGGEAMAKYAVAIQLLITQIVKFLRKDLNQSISAVKRRNAQLQEEERKYQERLAGFRKGWVFGTAYVSVKQGIEYILSRPELRKAVFGLMSKAFGLIPGIGPLLSIVLDEIADKGRFDLHGFLSEVFKMGAGKFFQFVAMKALGKVLPANIPPKALAFINKGAKAVADKVGRAGAVGALQAIGVKEKKIDAETEKAVKEVEKMTGSGKKGGSRKSGYIASLIAGKNKPMELSKFVKQSDAFKTYTLPQLIKKGVVKMDTEESRNLADTFFTKAGKLRKGTDLGRLIGEFAEDTFVDKMIKYANKQPLITNIGEYIERVKYDIGQFEEHKRMYPGKTSRYNTYLGKPLRTAPQNIQDAYSVFTGQYTLKDIKDITKRRRRRNAMVHLFREYYPMFRPRGDRDIYLEGNAIVFDLGGGKFKKPSIPLQILDFLGVDKVVDRRGYAIEEPKDKSWNKSAFKKSNIPKTMEKKIKENIGSSFV